MLPKGGNKYKGPMEIVEHLSDNIVKLRNVKTGQLYVPNEVHIADLKPKFGRTEQPEAGYEPPESKETEENEENDEMGSETDVQEV